MINLVPAYGRDYKSKKSVEDDFNSNKDFMIQDISSPYNGKYVNKSQLEGLHQKVSIRYKKLQSVAIIVVK